MRDLNSRPRPPKGRGNSGLPQYAIKWRWRDSNSRRCPLPERGGLAAGPHRRNVLPIASYVVAVTEQTFIIREVHTVLFSHLLCGLDCRCFCIVHLLRLSTCFIDVRILRQQSPRIPCYKPVSDKSSYWQLVNQCKVYILEFHVNF